MDMEFVKHALATYDGPPMRVMEVCGSHTEAVARYGITSILSPNLTLLSGPGCPVCVATSAYIDRLCKLAEEGCVIVTFGDLIRVPGRLWSLSDMRSRGARVEMVYSPLDVIHMAAVDSDSRYVFAAVGFETTTPVYALLMEEIIHSGLKNIRLLTALKTMPAVIGRILSDGAEIDGFLAPGHVSVVTGSGVFEPLAQKYGVPFGVAGFTARELLIALYGIVSHRNHGVVKNYYPTVVTKEGNREAREKTDLFFEKCDAAWRGLGVVPGSGMRLRDEFASYDAGSMGLDADEKINPACHCDEVLIGKMAPPECSLYGRMCRPETPQGACMVSAEGSCYSYYVNRRNDN